MTHKQWQVIRNTRDSKNIYLGSVDVKLNGRHYIVGVLENKETGKRVGVNSTGGIGGLAVAMAKQATKFNK